jgi:hypothetical protein
MRTLLDDLEKEAKEKNTPSSLFEFERRRASFYRDQSRAGQVPPGEMKSALQVSKGALARPGRRSYRSHAEEPKSSRFTFNNIYEKRT